MGAESTVSNVRYERGMELLRSVGGDSADTVIDGIAEIAPDLARYTVEFGYGDIYHRPGLTLRQRQLANIAALAAMGTAAPQLRFHIDGALNVGVTPAEVVETLIHISVYSGIPAAINGLTVAKTVFADRPESASPVVVAPISPEETLAERHQRGLEALDRIDGEAGHQVVAALADIAPDLAGYIIDFSFGDVYSRPGLDLPTRELVTVAACTALGTAAPQLRVHLHGLLNVGGTRAEAIEVITQMAAYAGFPAALNALTAAREVFAHRDAEGRSE
ncbi:carboxymuconolactone decarboxylase [Nocardia yunnanensis]|uniref:Carboxymuconolactone decarboxylase n=1 Tax=Nocardia yunnanensis TaxID=2382165 RepID=A0A386ZFU1_9NOCA|nr:carboxymuconolactone decarboxylase family protein [Nocardia yunnanensis]AYF76398.1 carboxymuconolactone decarboxylase [Nocardia yunnanensis]